MFANVIFCKPTNRKVVALRRNGIRVFPNAVLISGDQGPLATRVPVAVPGGHLSVASLDSPLCQDPHSVNSLSARLGLPATCDRWSVISLADLGELLEGSGFASFTSSYPRGLRQCPRGHRGSVKYTWGQRIH